MGPGSKVADSIDVGLSGSPWQLLGGTYRQQRRPTQAFQLY